MEYSLAQVCSTTRNIVWCNRRLQREGQLKLGPWPCKKAGMYNLSRSKVCFSKSKRENCVNARSYWQPLWISLWLISLTNAGMNKLSLCYTDFSELSYEIRVASFHFFSFFEVWQSNYVGNNSDVDSGDDSVWWYTTDEEEDVRGGGGGGKCLLLLVNRPRRRERRESRTDAFIPSQQSLKRPFCRIASYLSIQ